MRKLPGTISKSAIGYPAENLHVWNPLRGCSRKNCVFTAEHPCWAETMCNTRFKHLAEPGKSWAGFEFDKPEWFQKDFDKKFPSKPANILVNFMSDAAELDYGQWLDIGEKIEAHPQHNFWMLTKRPKQAYCMFPSYDVPSNLWLGFSATDGWEYHTRLQDMPISDRGNINIWASCEPMRRNIDIIYSHNGIVNHWIGNDSKKAANFKSPSLIVIGGMSGKNAVKLDHSCIYNLVTQCQQKEINYTVKQWSSVNPGPIGPNGFPLIGGHERMDWPALSELKEKKS